MLVSITSLPGNDRGPRHMEAVLRALQHGNERRIGVTLGFAMLGDQVGLFCEFPPQLRRTMLDHMQDAYPECAFKTLDDAALNMPVSCRSFVRNVRLTPDVLSIQGFKAFEDSLERSLAEPDFGKWNRR